MKHKVIITTFALGLAMQAEAQSFTQHLQQSKGNASVTVTQSKEIDDLVNNADVSARTQKQSSANNAKQQQQQHSAIQPAATHKAAATQQHADAAKTEPAHRHDNDSTKKALRPHEAEEKKKEEPVHHDADAAQTGREPDETETQGIDTRKKMMRRSYKVNGYRVQVFAGGNSRNDKIKAQEAGNKVKAAFPDQPVYVHFYSPRWICRIGNYRTYQEASAVLARVQKLGYRHACIVSGKITVAY